MNSAFREIIEEYKFARFKDLKNLFNNDNGLLFNINDYAQVGLMNYSMSNFYPLFQELLDEVQPKTFCEIGVDTGFTTYLLNDLCLKYQARLHSVDPVIDLDSPPVSSSHITYWKEKSNEYFRKKIHNDVYFLDGEHTYDAVYEEIDAVSANVNMTSKSSLIFLHDMSWPHSYRDVIYDKDSYPYERKTGKGYLFPTDNSFTEYGMPMFYAEVTSYEGGEKNGLLKAVEDFLQRNPDWDFCKVPSLYGFGILWNKKLISMNVEALLKKIKNEFIKYSPFLSFLELNRFLLISRIEFLHITTNKDKDSLQKEISRLKEALDTQDAEKSQFSETISTLKNQNISLVNELERVNAEKSETDTILRNQNISLVNELEKLKHEKQQLLSSKSWKITKPLRILERFFK